MRRDSVGKMKTLDEVIKGLSVCDDVECCYACPHSTDYNGCEIGLEQR